MKTAVERSRAWLETALFLFAAAAVCSFYVWSARTEDSPWNFGRPQSDYYNLLVDGMLDGHLSLKIDVPPELLALPDPYDPAKRPAGLGLHDASLYRGRYYLYFGAAPVVTLLLPFRLMTHVALPLPMAVVIFACAGYLVAATTWWLVRRRYFQESGPWISVLGLIALGTASFVPILVRRANIWELPITGAYFYGAVSMLCIYGSLHARRGNAFWLAGASLAVGLAVASRPTYLYSVGVLLISTLWLWRQSWRNGGARWRDGARYALAAGVPLALVGAAMAAYNYARFGNPLEFGVAYQFSGIYEAKAHHFSLSYLPYNLGLFAFAPVAWSIAFPFIHVMPAAAPPTGHFGIEEVRGVALHLPVIWVGTAGVIAALRRPRDASRRLLVFIAAIVAAGVGTLLTLSCFYAAIGRYEVDFLGWFAMFGAIGMVAAAHELRHVTALYRWTGLVLAGAAGLVSAFFAVAFNLTIYGNFARSNPAEYRHLARVADYPAYWLDRLRQSEYGQAKLTVRFVAQPDGCREPLLQTGWWHFADHVFIEHGDHGSIRFGFAHDSGGRFYSAWLPVDLTAAHEIRLDVGSLYPPETSPWYAGFAPAAVRAAVRRVRIDFDGRRVLDEYERLYPNAPARTWFGRESDGNEFGMRFSGEILRVSREADWRAAVAARPTDSPAPAVFTTIGMTVRLPDARRVGVHEPLITTGDTGGADFLYLEYRDAVHVRLALGHWGKPPIASPDFEWRDGETRRIEVHLGSFPGPAEPDNRVSIRVDGALVWSAPARFYRAEAADVFIGRNPVGGSEAEPIFPGSITDVVRK